MMILQKLLYKKTTTTTTGEMRGMMHESGKRSEQTALFLIMDKTRIIMSTWAADFHPITSEHPSHAHTDKPVLVA
eukprot:scaffold1418_cov92-Skeletonema_dohrnii-CCMP3373.AAC.7